MPRKPPKTAVDVIGRPTSDAALAAHDAKGLTHNYAGDRKVRERAARFVSDFIGRADMTMAILMDKMAVWYANWNGDPTSDYFPTGRSVHVPEAFKAVETFVPRAANILTGQPKWFRVKGIDDSGKENAEKITNLILAQLQQDGFYSKFRGFLRDSAIYGYAPGKIRWRHRRKKFKYTKVQEEEAGANRVLKTSEDEQTVILDGPTLEPVDVADFVVDLRFHEIQNDSPGVCFRQERFEDELKEMRDRGVYSNVDALISETSTPERDVQVSGPLGTAINPATHRQLRDAANGISIDLMHRKPQARIYEVYEFWGKFDKDWDEQIPGSRGEEREFVITLARRMANQKDQKGGWTVLRVAENPYWHGQRPVVVCHHIRRSNCFQSMGIIEPITRLCSELDDSRNMALAARSLAAAPAIIATDDADIYQNNLILDPGTILRARNKDAIAPFVIPDLSNAAYKAEEAIKRDIREATGMTAPLQGVTEESSETATSVVTRTRESNKRIAEVCQNIAFEFLIPMLEQFHALNQQLITEERLVEVMGPDGISMDLRKMNPAEIAGKVSFEIMALPQIEMAGIEARMLMAFLNQAGAFLQLDPSIVRPAELLKMAWQKEFGVNEMDRVFPSADKPLRLRTAEDEHQIMCMGHMLEPQEGENYHAHFQQHSAFMQSPEYQKQPEDAQKRILVHARNTKLRLNEEMEAAMPRTPPLPPMSPMEAAMQGGPGGPGGGPPGMGPPSGGAPGPSQQQGPPRQGMGQPTTPTGQVRSQIAGMEPRVPYGTAKEE